MKEDGVVLTAGERLSHTIEEQVGWFKDLVRTGKGMFSFPLL
jgi:hypothetical protein